MTTQTVQADNGHVPGGRRYLLHMFRPVLAVASMMLSAVTGGFISTLLGYGIRDMLPFIIMAILILAASSAFRWLSKWAIKDFVASLFIANLIVLFIISHFSESIGIDILDRYNLELLVFMNLFIGLPWAVGFGIGSLILWEKGRKQSQV